MQLLHIFQVRATYNGATSFRSVSIKLLHSSSSVNMWLLQSSSWVNMRLLHISQLSQHAIASHISAQPTCNSFTSSSAVKIRYSHYSITPCGGGASRSSYTVIYIVLKYFKYVKKSKTFKYNSSACIDKKYWMLQYPCLHHTPLPTINKINS